MGKHGQLGGCIRCVVSVSMLTEGWDADTVTHILGIRASAPSSSANRSSDARYAANPTPSMTKVSSTSNTRTSSAFLSTSRPSPL